MGMGRNSSRIASRRLATSSKESGNYREDLDEGKLIYCEIKEILNGWHYLVQFPCMRIQH